jgi:serpin B
VSENTRGRIGDLLREEDVDPATMLVLTHAVHFGAPWRNRFDAGRTRAVPFRVPGGGFQAVPMMHRTGLFPYASLEGLEILELPYEGDRLSMVVLLPSAPDGLTGLEASLTPDNLDRWLGRLEETQVRVALPRFRLRSRFDLGETLRDMGVTDAFDPDRADFSGMSGNRDLFLSLVLHQAGIELDEEGTEADAGTVVVLRKGPGPVTFTADRPFLFLVLDRHDGGILFLGRLANPVE